MNTINGILQTKINPSTVYEISKPPGTVKTDYVILFGKCFVSFDIGTDIIAKEVCRTNKQRVDAIKETDTHLIIEI